MKFHNEQKREHLNESREKEERNRKMKTTTHSHEWKETKRIKSAIMTIFSTNKYMSNKRTIHIPSKTRRAHFFVDTIRFFPFFTFAIDVWLMEETVDELRYEK